MQVADRTAAALASRDAVMAERKLAIERIRNLDAGAEMMRRIGMAEFAAEERRKALDVLRRTAAALADEPASPPPVVAAVRPATRARECRSRPRPASAAGDGTAESSDPSPSTTACSARGAA